MLGRAAEQAGNSVRPMKAQHHLPPARNSLLPGGPGGFLSHLGGVSINTYSTRILVYFEKYAYLDVFYSISFVS